MSEIAPAMLVDNTVQTSALQPAQTEALVTITPQPAQLPPSSTEMFPGMLQSSTPLRQVAPVVVDANNNIGESEMLPSADRTPALSDKKLLRTWLRRLSDAKPLSFKDTEELNALMDMYDTSDVHPIQYNMDSRFKERLPFPNPELCNIARKNSKRNRTEENHPTDEGLLKTPNGEFFNASVIDARDRQYIATQHPLPSTMLEFWKMVLNEKPCVVVMLNKYEFDQALERKADQSDFVQYWPGDNPVTGFTESILLEDPESGGVVKVSVVDDVHHKIEDLIDVDSPKNDVISPNPGNSPPISVSPTSSSPPLTCMTPPSAASPDMVPCPASPLTPLESLDSYLPQISSPIQSSSHFPLVSALPPVDPITTTNPSPSPPLSSPPCSSPPLKHKALECSKLRVELDDQKHEVWHIRCSGWKDQEAPNLDMFMDLWRLVEEKVRSHHVRPGEKHKIVVHCTGGVGRTGTFIAIDIAGQELKARMGETASCEGFSVENIIQFLRSKRMNMVGSIPQYVFCHRAALKVLSDLKTAHLLPQTSV